MAAATTALACRWRKRSGSLPSKAGDRDTLITSVIGQAVSYVSRLNGLPLFEDTRTYRVSIPGATAFARILQPIGWPRPIRGATFRAYAADTSITDTPAVVADVFGYDAGLGAWTAPPSMFGFTAWPTYDQAEVDVVVALDPLPERYVAAVVVVLRALYTADIRSVIRSDIPQTVADLIR